MNKRILVLTERPDSELNRKIIKAAEKIQAEVVLDEPHFSVLSRLLKNEFGIFIYDSEDIRELGNLFYRAARVLRNETPHIFFAPDYLLLENIGATLRSKHQANVEELSRVLLKALKFNHELVETNKEFRRRHREISHLVGDELKEAQDKLRMEVFSPKFEKISEEDDDFLLPPGKHTPKS